ncbi:MAG TPA: hypothetical protein VMT37_16710 [Solirubrobacterales bacterium]|nr:hypothetical protein [Solirubrobacterales bacterium]
MKSGERRTGRCAGKPAPYQPASYVGTVEFHGENGYTDVSASTVAIEYPALFRLFCGLVSVGELTTSGVGLPGAALTVGGRGREAPLHIDAHKNKKAGRTWLSASESETREGIAISRSVSVVAGPDAFEYDPTLRWATLSPPAPFSGTGAFHRGAAKANRWTGDLSVDFPGDPGASLTAPGLGVRLVHSEYSQHRS